MGSFCTYWGTDYIQQQQKNNTAKKSAQEISIVWFNFFFCDDRTCKKTQFRHGETWIYKAVTKSRVLGISPRLLMSMIPSYFRSKQKENETKRTPLLFSCLATWKLSNSSDNYSLWNASHQKSDVRVVLEEKTSKLYSQSIYWFNPPPPPPLSLSGNFGSYLSLVFLRSTSPS